MDNCDGSATVKCNPASGQQFAIGVTRVNCSAVDIAGNTVEDHFNVNITGTLTGISISLEIYSYLVLLRFGVKLRLRGDFGNTI